MNSKRWIIPWCLKYISWRINSGQRYSRTSELFNKHYSKQVMIPAPSLLKPCHPSQLQWFLQLFQPLFQHLWLKVQISNLVFPHLEGHQKMQTHCLTGFQDSLTLHCLTWNRLWLVEGQTCQHNHLEWVWWCISLCCPFWGLWGWTGWACPYKIIYSRFCILLQSTL